MAISADFTINSAANPARHTTTYGSTVNLAVSNTAGIQTYTWEIVGSSKSGTTFPTITTAGTPDGATASFAMPADPSDGLGRAFLVKFTATAQYETASTIGVVGVENNAGQLPVCFGEDFARDATYGWTDELNQALNVSAVGTRTAISASRSSAATDPGLNLVYDGASAITYTVDDDHFTPGQFVDFMVTGTGSLTVAVTGTASITAAPGQSLVLSGEDRSARLYAHGSPGDTPAPFTWTKFGEQEFTNDTANGGNPTAQVAPNAIVQVSNLGNSSNTNYDVAFSDDGVYRAGISIVLKRETTEDYRTWIGTVDFKHESSAVALIGSAAAGASGDSTGLTVTVSANSANLRINIANATSEEVDGYINVQWIKSDLVA